MNYTQIKIETRIPLSLSLSLSKSRKKNSAIYFCATAAVPPASPPPPLRPSSCEIGGGFFLDAGVTASLSGGTTTGIARPIPPMMNDHVMIGSWFFVELFRREREREGEKKKKEKR